MNHTYILNIAGTHFSILSDEPEAYIRSLEAKVSDMVERAQLRGASSHKAALFVCMELCDLLEKAKSAETAPKSPKKSFDELFFPDKDQISLF